MAEPPASCKNELARRPLCDESQMRTEAHVVAEYAGCDGSEVESGSRIEKQAVRRDEGRLKEAMCGKCGTIRRGQESFVANEWIV